MEAVEYNRMAALHAQRWLGLGSTVYLSLGKARRQRLFSMQIVNGKLGFWLDLTTPYMYLVSVREPDNRLGPGSWEDLHALIRNRR